MKSILRKFSNISHIPDLGAFLSTNISQNDIPNPSQSTNGLKYYIQTYGCQMNENDSEIVAGILKNAGMESVSSPDLVLFT